MAWFSRGSIFSSLLLCYFSLPTILAQGNNCGLDSIPTACLPDFTGNGGGTFCCLSTTAVFPRCESVQVGNISDVNSCCVQPGSTGCYADFAPDGEYCGQEDADECATGICCPPASSCVGDPQTNFLRCNFAFPPNLVGEFNEQMSGTATRSSSSASSTTSTSSATSSSALASSTGSSSTPSPTVIPEEDDEGGLSTGGAVGVGLVAGAAAVLLGFGAWFLYRRRMKRNQPPAYLAELSGAHDKTGVTGNEPMHELAATNAKYELGSNAPR